MVKPWFSRFLLLFCVPALASAQQSNPPAPPPAQSQLPAATLGEGRFKLDIVVTDKAGKPVSGLNAEDFTIQDNNIPGKILSFHAIEDPMQKTAPVQAILVLDAVNREHSIVDSERVQIQTFLRRNGGRLPLPVSVLLFTDAGLKVLAKPSLDGDAMAAQIEKASTGFRMITAAGGAYGAYELFDRGTDALKALIAAETGKPGRKLIIWIGPGWPQLDRAEFGTSAKGQQNLFELIVRMSSDLREAHIAVYDVSEGLPDEYTFIYQYFLKGVKSPQKANFANLSVKVLATESGGRAFSPSNDLASDLATCIQDAAPYYTLSFDPPHADKQNEYHDLKIQIARPGLTARTSTGYCNQP
jgi:VWFA-related protein